jgi:myo-inositol 2-dehydrogenase / D-chiro-inositol 1-dehydrogenase
MNIGLIGYGAWGQHHAAAIAETADMQLAAVCAHSAASAGAARAKFNVTATRDYRELLALPGLDAVDIVLPTHLHHEVASAALRAGKHVLLEKPMAIDPRQCAELIERAQASGKVLYIGHEARLSTQWGRMRELISEGLIGRAQYVTIDLWRRPYRLGSDRWRYDAARVGSWVLEEPIHFFDLACWWLAEAGPPVSVYARASRLPSTPEGLWDNVAAMVDFPAGAHAVITQTLAAAEHHQSAKVVGERGALLAFWDGEMDRTTHPRASLKLARGGQLEELPIALCGEFFELRSELAHFAAVCRGEARPIITPQEAALSVSLCWAAEQSIRTGVAVVCS